MNVSNMNRTMEETMRLMRSGDLHAATAAIQRALADGTPQDGDTAAGAPHGAIDAEYTVVRDGAEVGSAPRVQTVPPPSGQAAETATTRAANSPTPATFVEHRFAAAAGTLQYKLFIPAGRATEGLPLVVMLHGCTQSPDDFARGTRMNALAQQHGYVIAYPAQSQKQNPSKCWNWFRTGDQQRDRGEPALLAALTKHLVATHGLDARRVFVAGMSAGGAMAAVLGSTYPDLYAAIGVHSGLPFGIAHDVPSALAAMQKRAGVPASRRAGPTGPLPAIVFHGDQDKTVDPCNGAAVVEQFTGPGEAATLAKPAGATRVEQGVSPHGRRYTRTLHLGGEAQVVGEHWVIHGSAHAWSGGDRSGSYTDPAGPDASAEMLRFFNERAPA